MVFFNTLLFTIPLTGCSISDILAVVKKQLVLSKENISGKINNSKNSDKSLNTYNKPSLNKNPNELKDYSAENENDITPSDKSGSDQVDYKSVAQQMPKLKENKDTGEMSDGQGIIIEPKKPQINLEVFFGPEYAQDNNICYFRVRAHLTGDPFPAVKFNRDDSNGAWGTNVAQINLAKGESFEIVCIAENSAGSASSALNLHWIEPSSEETVYDNTYKLDNQEITDIIDFTNPADFLIDVNLTLQKVSILYKGDTLKVMPCSGGKTETPTPTGNFKTSQKIYWAFVPKFNQGAYYWTRFYGSYLFHSVPYDENKNMLTEELAKIGTPASHGCIRLYLEDARWLYETLPLGVEVYIHN